MDKDSLLGGGPEDYITNFEGRSDLRRKKQAFTKLLPWILNVCLAITVLYLLNKRSGYTIPPSEIFSPAQDAVEYETIVFSSSFGNQKTKYQGTPSQSVDEAWQGLYDAHGISRIDKATAKKLPNMTAPIPNDPGYYIVGLEVFHHLHCLNHLRMLLYPDYYDMTHQLADPEELDHLDHCVDMLRQALMCHSDISTLYWEWRPKHQKTMMHADTTHTCRKFEKIKEWALEHRALEFDETIHVEIDE